MSTDRPGGPSTEEERALKLFVVLSRASRAVSDRNQRDIRSYGGLNPTEFAVLELLYHKGDQPLQHIGDKILLASGSITYVVDKLQQKGLLERKPCPKDRRITYASISNEGRRFMDEIFPQHRRKIAETMSVLTDQEQDALIGLLRKLGYYAKEH